jgi:hypothetical protein
MIAVMALLLAVGAAVSLDVLPFRTTPMGGKAWPKDVVSAGINPVGVPFEWRVVGNDNF